MCTDSAVARDRAIGAPADMKIEITPEMIEAGAAELFDDSPTGILLGPYGAEDYAKKVDQGCSGCILSWNLDRSAITFRS
jgi:hypothetical protein